MVQGHQRQEEEEDRGVEEVVVVEGEEEDLQKPTVEPEGLEGLEEQGLKRNNQSIHLFISRDTTFPKKKPSKTVQTTTEQLQLFNVCFKTRNEPMTIITSSTCSSLLAC